MLASLLERFEGDRIAVAGSIQDVRFRDLANAGRSGIRARILGRSVAVMARDPLRALECLICADGSASRLLLLSPTLDLKTARDLVNRVGCDIALVGAPAPTGGLGAIPHITIPDYEQEPSNIEGAARAERVETRWLLTTSGTTGAPKVVDHSLDSLTCSVNAGSSTGAGVRWGLLYDLARFAGLQVVLQSVLSGAVLLVPPQESPLGEQIDFLGSRGCTHLSATPTLWRKILMLGGERLVALRQITLGGEIADSQVLRALKSAFPQARVTHIFASTEAGYGFSVSDGEQGFPSSFLTRPPSGVELKVLNGRLCVRNRRVSPCYVGEDWKLADEDGFIDTGDMVLKRGNRFVFLGRSNGAISVGGDKVLPEVVEQVILAHPDVLMARVFGTKNPIVGALVSADVVLKPAVGDLPGVRAALIRFCQERLPRHQVPAILRIVEDLPNLESGKLARS